MTLCVVCFACVSDVEASSCQRVIHKKVGDTVELPSCLPTDGVTDAAWKYGRIKLADKDMLFHEKQFKDRLELNHQNFSLTVKQLTLQDSGNFSFLSEVYGTQRETVIITLQVHGRILPFLVKRCELKKNQMCLFIVCRSIKSHFFTLATADLLPKTKIN